jgi:hypothetical protein
MLLRHDGRLAGKALDYVEDLVAVSKLRSNASHQKPTSRMHVQLDLDRASIILNSLKRAVTC